jgi:RNA polymerase sigma-70 factor (ECF subfamily)
VPDNSAQTWLNRPPERSRIHSPQAFLFTTARHIAFDRIRRWRNVSLDALTESQRSGVLGTTAAPDHEVNTRQQLALLMRAIAALPERCRQVLTMRKLYGLSQKEIASRLGIAEHTVEKHVATGMRLITRFMNTRERN